MDNRNHDTLKILYRILMEPTGNVVQHLPIDGGIEKHNYVRNEAFSKTWRKVNQMLSLPPLFHKYIKFCNRFRILHDF